jgi:hypothetical protein
MAADQVTDAGYSPFMLTQVVGRRLVEVDVG